jgi:asparagine synthase (glutamine-hydrolysing)
MCGIAGIISLKSDPIENLQPKLEVMDYLQKHRGPDGHGFWIHSTNRIGFAHQRLSIIDLNTGDQPMQDPSGNWIVYNGEIYNYLELREELGVNLFRTSSDTEVILLAYQKWGEHCVEHLRGMFSFALWDEQKQLVFCARDRFGIKPFYYSIVNNAFYFASEVKAILPFLDNIETDLDGFKDYLSFQFPMAGKTLFKNINELLPAHTLKISDGAVTICRFWEIYFDLDLYHNENYFLNKLRELLLDSVRIHLRSDVPIGSYASGGLDSSTVAALAKTQTQYPMLGFTGKFSAYGHEYDESSYAQLLADKIGIELHQIDITCQDFIANIQKVIYYLDYPVAGPGSFPQFMVSALASKYRKVVLGGQGGDEIFGGYTRYLIAYFEQCIKAAIDGTMNNGNFVVTYESIIPNLSALRNYKPLLQEFWSEGLFDEMDHRYFRLVNRAPHLKNEIRWNLLGDYSPFESFKKIFNNGNVPHTSYFDQMTHFDFKTLLPALLQVEDRMSMAFGLESRVPILDHPLIELAATIPANIKFKDGTMKYIFGEVARPYIPAEILNRKDKMGFPTPLNHWINGQAKEFIIDLLSSKAALSRDLIDNRKALEVLGHESKYGRNIWGLLSLEIWQQEFHDKSHAFHQLVKEYMPT